MGMSILVGRLRDRFWADLCQRLRVRCKATAVFVSAGCVRVGEAEAPAVPERDTGGGMDGRRKHGKAMVIGAIPMGIASKGQQSERRGRT
jgi:hypothetical protein